MLFLPLWKEQIVTLKRADCHFGQGGLPPANCHLERSNLSPWKEQFVTLDTADCHLPKYFPPWKEDCHLEKAAFVALKRGGCLLQMGGLPTGRPIRDTLKHCPCYRLFADSTGKVQGLLWTRSYPAIGTRFFFFFFFLASVHFIC